MIPACNDCQDTCQRKYSYEVIQFFASVYYFNLYKDYEKLNTTLQLALQLRNNPKIILERGMNCFLFGGYDCFSLVWNHINLTQQSPGYFLYKYPMQCFRPEILKSLQTISPEYKTYFFRPSIPFSPGPIMVMVHWPCSPFVLHPSCTRSHQCYSKFDFVCKYALWDYGLHGQQAIHGLFNSRRKMDCIMV